SDHYFFSLFFFQRSSYILYLHFFPTRRSSDLSPTVSRTTSREIVVPEEELSPTTYTLPEVEEEPSAPKVEDVEAIASSVAEIARDRKSTRLNSSHVAISYAVFCLKKKTKQYDH